MFFLPLGKHVNVLDGPSSRGPCLHVYLAAFGHFLNQPQACVRVLQADCRVGHIKFVSQ